MVAGGTHRALVRIYALGGVTLAGAGLFVAWAIAAGLVPTSARVGFDSEAYWTVSLANPYTASAYGLEQGFHYSPAAAQAFALINWLPWPAFLVLWAVPLAVSMTLLAGPLTIPLAATSPGALTLLGGNVELVMYLAIAVGFRWPQAWAVVLLTKLTSGVGLLWFVARGEWRSLALALGATGVVAAVSFALAPALWFEWFGYLGRIGGGGPPPVAIQVPLIPRMVAASALVVWGARTDRPQTVPVAAWLALPGLWGWGVLLALPAFVDWHKLGRAGVVAPLLGSLGATRRAGARGGSGSAP